MAHSYGMHLDVLSSTVSGVVNNHRIRRRFALESLSLVVTRDFCWKVMKDRHDVFCTLYALILFMTSIRIHYASG